MSAVPVSPRFTLLDQLRSGREVIRLEGEALVDLSRHLDPSFCSAVDLVASCEGSIVVTGMGKAGLVGQKIAATLSSTGSRSHFLHPAEAVHGDLGCLHHQDVLLALSNSGETEEICQLLPTVTRLRVPIIAVTSTDRNTLASRSDVVIQIGKLREACPWGLAPSTSTTAMLAVGDALALVASTQRGFTPQQFAVFHPAGSLGRQLRTVGELMRPLKNLRVARETDTVRDVFVRFSNFGRRSAAILLLDEAGRLAGMFTDSDLARLLERRRDAAFDSPISAVMNSTPLTLRPESTFAEVVDLLADRKISEVPVVDDDRRPVGLIDITDVIGWLPPQSAD